MRRAAAAVVLTACLACAVAAAGAGAATQPIRFGVADDTGKYAADGGASFFSQISTVGLDVNRMTVTWDAAHPTLITEQAFLDRSIATAVKAGVQVWLAVRPARAGAVGSSVLQATRFAGFVVRLAKRYPQVHTFVIGNEPNQPRFWQPQFVNGKAVAAAGYERMLAASYDALKAVDPTITVVGGVISSRGNDNPRASSNSSRSPLWFIHDLGVAYRASKRTKPIMDEFGFHPYPRSDRDSLSRGFDWPDAGFTNLALVKQALWDAFNGTAQPTVENGLRIAIDEVGWQTEVPASSRGAYSGLENVPVDSEQAQATVYQQLIAHSSCDASISDLLFMPFVDEPQLSGVQSGLLRADGTERPSYDAVRSALAGGVRCAAAPTHWRHLTTVVGARALFGPALQSHWRRQRSWSFNLKAGEDATYRASIVPLAGRSVLSVAAALAARPALTARGRAEAGWTPRVRFPARQLAPGRYVYVVQLRAVLDPSRRSSFVSRSFVVR